jgi:putative (di)nucleoside polyphosphate hydrolase
VSAKHPHAEPDPRYRRNVGVVLFNREGQVWLGRRFAVAGPHNWQFPQGGVDAGEDFLTAARRELQEETGVRSVSLIAEAPGWITYDFPNELVAARKRGYAGQAQRWFAFRFEGQDGEIDLEADAHPEFDAWRWADLDEAMETVVPFKRAAYEQVLAAFRHIGAEA